MKLVRSFLNLGVLFKLIWKLPTPPRINTFIWKVAHGRLMTNSQRLEYRICNSDLCPRCVQQPESILHVLRDCECVLQLWEKLVNPDEWHKFASLGLMEWLLFNFTAPNIGIGDSNWPILFGTMLYMLWIDRNHFVFSERSAMLDQFLPKVMGQVDAIHSHLLKPEPSFMEGSHQVIFVAWDPPPPGVLKLNVDGSHRHQYGLSACGGLLRDYKGQFIIGFHRNLGASSSIAAEIWGLLLGLRLAKSMSVGSLLVELDSRVVTHMVTLRRSHSHSLQPLIGGVLSLVESSDWVCNLRHVYREANRCACRYHGGVGSWREFS